MAIGRVPDASSPSNGQPYFDGTSVDFEVEGTGFLYAYTPIEFAERKSPPDPKTGAVYYLATVWVVTCKHCVENIPIVGVRLNIKSTGTRVYTIRSEQWTMHPREDVAVSPMAVGIDSDNSSVEELDLVTVDRKSTAPSTP